MRIIFIVCFVLFGYSVYSQGDYYGTNLNSNLYTASNIIVNPSVQPPDVAAFQKSTFVPVSNYTGRANVQVPIYTIKEGNIEVPISLSYNSSGVKVQDMASSVGLNWSLNAGGMITRMIKGMNDFHFPMFTNYDWMVMSPAGWLGYTPPYNNLYTKGQVNPENDAEPDHFVVNAPGLSTTYVHKRDYNPGDLASTIAKSAPPSPLELEHQGNQINETFGILSESYFNDHTQAQGTLDIFGINNIEIISIDGLKYHFATPEISRYHGPSSGSMYKIESNRLDKIYDPVAGRGVYFDYESYSNYFYDEKKMQGGEYGGGADFDFGNGPSYTVYPVAQRLKKIRFSGGEVEFIYGALREDNTGDKALIEIKIKDSKGSTVKHIKLQQSYFQSNIDTTSPQSKRLRLDRVYEVSLDGKELPGYKFSYDTSVQQPPRDSYAHDFLGYNNGSYNSSLTSPIPKYYFINNKVTPFYSSSAIALPGNFSLASNLTHAKAYSLKSMTIPTGGVNEYFYELNEFDGIKGGGLRISKQIIRDENGKEEIEEYEYYYGRMMRLPEYAVYKIKKTGFRNATNLVELETYLGIDTFMAAHSHVEFTNGSYVGYDRVVVIKDTGNGSTEYRYSNTANLNSSKTIGWGSVSDKDYSEDWKKIAAPGLSVSRDFMRGKLLGEKIFDKNNELRLSKSYGYTLKTFETLNLSYLNKAFKSGPLGCTSPQSGEYELYYCGGYYESIALPIARYLLSSIFIQDYANGPSHTPFEVGKYYTYHQDFPLVTFEEVNTCDDRTRSQGLPPCNDSSYAGEIFSHYKKITYPQEGRDMAPFPYAADLVAQNRLSTPLKIEWSDTGISEEYVYDWFNYGLDLSLKEIKTIHKSGTTESSSLITKRNSRGDIEEYKDKNGIYHVYLYDFPEGNIIAKISNATYQQVMETGFDLRTHDEGSESIKIAELDKIQYYLPHAFVEYYTYKPLIGISTATDIKGQTTYYSYDSFNRLHLIRDAEGNPLTEYKYNYKGKAN